MAGIITILKGRDASYPWKQIGTEPDPAQARQPKRYGVGYYLSPAEHGGEPPGIWTGKDVAELGLEPGGIVDRKVFDPLHARHLDPATQQASSAIPSDGHLYENVLTATTTALTLTSASLAYGNERAETLRVSVAAASGASSGAVTVTRWQ